MQRSSLKLVCTFDDDMYQCKPANLSRMTNQIADQLRCQCKAIGYRVALSEIRRMQIACDVQAADRQLPPTQVDEALNVMAYACMSKLV